MEDAYSPGTLNIYCPTGQAAAHLIGDQFEAKLPRKNKTKNMLSTAAHHSVVCCSYYYWSGFFH